MFEKNESDIFYIYPMLNEGDLYQYEYVKRVDPKHFYSLGLKSKRHGMVVYKCCIDKIINEDKASLKAIFSKFNGNTPLQMSLKFVGGGKTIMNIIDQVRRMIK